MRAAIRKVIALDFGNDPQRLPPIPDTGIGEAAESKRIALLVTSDSVSQQWAPRWLQHSGLEVRVAANAEQALALEFDSAPSLIIADAACPGPDGRPLVETLREMHGNKVPLIALCAGNADVSIAADANVTDLVRRPYDWQVITRRAVAVVRANETEASLRGAQEKLAHLQTNASVAERDRAKAAGIDKLTNLPNGDRFRSLLHRSVAVHGKSGEEIAVLVLGIDRFRMVNDAVGHENANRLLVHFADRLKSCLRRRDVVGRAEGGMVTAVAARLGTSQFALLISNAKMEEIVRVKQAVLSQLDQPFEVSGQSIYLTASIGAALFPRDSSNADDLLHSAETAMLDAQESGAGFQFFTQPGDEASSRLLNLDRMLREAMKNDELKLAYQPINDTATGETVGAEALLRWEHAEEGMISPADFVPVAEKTGLMTEIGEFVIHTACRQLRDWLDSGMEPIRMAVNLSLCQLLRGDVATVVEKALKDNRIEPQLLEIELSERGVLTQRPEVISEICRLKSIGVRISIDDFGTGHASIAYLKDLPVDVIKIDRSYISGAARTSRDGAIASGMVALAERLQATVIAEGVETEEQLETLRSWGSQECQGFYFSPAVAADEFLARFGRC